MERSPHELGIYGLSEELSLQPLEKSKVVH